MEITATRAGTDALEHEDAPFAIYGLVVIKAEAWLGGPQSQNRDASSAANLEMGLLCPWERGALQLLPSKRKRLLIKGKPRFVCISCGLSNPRSRHEARLVSRSLSHEIHLLDIFFMARWLKFASCILLICHISIICGGIEVFYFRPISALICLVGIAIFCSSFL